MLSYICTSYCNNQGWIYLSKKKRKKAKTEKISSRVKTMLDVGLWSYDIQVPEEQTLERLNILETDILKRIKEIHLPEKNAKKIYRQAISQYNKHSKVKRKKRKETYIEEKGKRNEIWKEYKKNNFVHLGKGVSNWLNFKEENENELQKYKLPSLPNASKLSKFLEMPISKIKFLAYHRKSSRIYHYLDFHIPKGKKGERLISKPKIDLARTQKIIKEQILDNLGFSDAVMGFIPGKSHLTNAREHLKRDFLINVDIQDFFPSVTFYQIRAIFRKLGYSGEISTVFALLTTKPIATKISINARNHYSFSENRSLPQGACTSPILSNLVLSKVDKQLIDRSISLGYKYSRYADDLTFSTGKSAKNKMQMLYTIHKTLELHKFTANPQKTKLLGKNNSQNVTGIVINSGNLNVPRSWRKNLRAAVHQFQYITDPEEKSNQLTKLLGCVNYLKISHSRLAQHYFELLTKYYQ